jgi:hypothetical protein
MVSMLPNVTADATATHTLTAILHPDENVFGGFTPVEWDSNSCWKGDDSHKNCFTLKNPHNVSARRFVLKGKMKHAAISGDF